MVFEDDVGLMVGQPIGIDDTSCLHLTNPEKSSCRREWIGNEAIRCEIATASSFWMDTLDNPCIP
jgi:hypothetical protein